MIYEIFDSMIIYCLYKGHFGHLEALDISIDDFNPRLDIVP